MSSARAACTASARARSTRLRSCPSIVVPAGARRVVMHDQGPVGRGLHVELHGVGAERGGGAEGRERVLELPVGRAAVRNDKRPTHLSRLAAFFGSIQPGSRSIVCTRSQCTGWGRTVFRYAAF